MIFAALDPTLPAIIGSFVVMLAGFFAIAKIMLKQASDDREADRKERQELTKAIEHMAKSSTDVALATKKSAQEAKQRNGHLGDQNLKLAKLVSSQNDDIAIMKDTATKNLQVNAKVVDILSKSAVIAAEDRDSLVNVNQIVQEQTVQHQTVRTKESK